MLTGGEFTLEAVGVAEEFYVAFGGVGDGDVEERDCGKSHCRFLLLLIQVGSEIRTGSMVTLDLVQLIIVVDLKNRTEDFSGKVQGGVEFMVRMQKQIEYLPARIKNTLFSLSLIMRCQA